MIVINYYRNCLKKVRFITKVFCQADTCCRYALTQLPAAPGGALLFHSKSIETAIGQPGSVSIVNGAERENSSTSAQGSTHQPNPCAAILINIR